MGNPIARREDFSEDVSSASIDAFTKMRQGKIVAMNRKCKKEGERGYETWVPKPLSTTTGN